MQCEILASVMNQKNKKEIIERLAIKENDKCLIINQVTTIPKPKKDANNINHRFISYNERGLSKSRNRALENAISDICIICDDDVSFVPNYTKIIKEAYEQHPDADIISFDFIGSDKKRKTINKGKVGFLRSMKLSSTQITFKRKSILNSDIIFDENFGAGSKKNEWGEENIFLFDCLRAGLKAYHIPIVTHHKGEFGTSWSRENSPKHYEQQGAIYYRMSPRWWRILALQFVLRKRKLYSQDMSGTLVYKSMVKGAKAYKKERKNG